MLTTAMPSTRRQYSDRRMKYKARGMLRRRIEKEFVHKKREGEEKKSDKGSTAQVYVDGLRLTEGALLCAT